MQVIYDNTRPAPVGSLMRVGDWTDNFKSPDMIFMSALPIVIGVGLLWLFLRK